MHPRTAPPGYAIDYLTGQLAAPKCKRTPLVARPRTVSSRGLKPRRSLRSLSYSTLKLWQVYLVLCVCGFAAKDKSPFYTV